MGTVKSSDFPVKLSVDVIAENQDSPCSIAVDENYVSWTTCGSGRMMRAAPSKRRT